MKVRLAKVLALGIIPVLTIGLALAACSQPAPTTTAPPQTTTPSTTAKPTTTAPSPTATATTPAAKVFEMKFAHYNVTTHPTHTMLAQYFANEVEKRSGGRIKVTIYPSAQLGKAEEGYDMVVTGRADVAHVLPSYTPGRFPMIDIGALPTMVLTSGKQGAEVMTGLAQEGLFDKEFSEVKLLGSAMTSPMPIGFTKKQPKTMADFKGLRVRTAGGYNTPAYEAMGMVPIQMATGEIYDALQKGLLDAVCEPPSSWISAKHVELLKYLIKNAPLLTQPSVLPINKAFWNKLPPDLQKIVADVGGDAEVNYGLGYDQQDAASMPKITAAGTTVYTLAAAEIKAMQDAMAPINKKWAADMDAKGLPGTKALADFYKLAAQFSNAK